VSVVTKAKWMDVRLFVQRYCSVCDGTLFGVMCKDRSFCRFCDGVGALCTIADGYIQRPWYIRLLKVKC
jgi:DnaJ-class molecular chaperone